VVGGGSTGEALSNEIHRPTDEKRNDYRLPPRFLLYQSSQWNEMIPPFAWIDSRKKKRDSSTSGAARQIKNAARRRAGI